MSKQIKKFQEIQQLQQQSIQQVHPINQRNYGACLILLRDQHGQPTLTLGPHFYVFIFAFLALSSLLIWLLITMKQRLTLFWFICMLSCTIIFMFSYLSIGLSVPGFASKSQSPTLQQKNHPKYCKPCKIIKNNNVYHCYDCDVCIQDYDHHCPWIGKCVGKNNLCKFYFFLFMTFGTLILCFISTLASANLSEKNIRVDNGKSQDKDKYTVKS